MTRIALKYLVAEKGSRVLLLGNEAIARGALEAGVCYFTGYPGTPSTEIIESVAEVGRDLNILVEWSVNEKVAYESAYAAAISGVRSLTAMKHVGLNVASDILVSSGYSGTKAGFVVVSADDPSAHSSQNEQDNRWYGFLAHIPVIEPSNVVEAYRLVKQAVRISEEFQQPIIFRSTTRVSHSRQTLELEEDIARERKCTGFFDKDISRWVLIPAHARRMKERAIKIWRSIENNDWGPPLLEFINPGREKAIVASGVAYNYVSEALSKLNAWDEVSVLKLNLTVPVPVKPILKLGEFASEILVVEELDPILEVNIRNILSKNGIRARVIGKDYIPESGELSVERVLPGVAKFLGKNITPPRQVEVELSSKIPPRPPVMCPGCPHRLTFYILKVAANRMRLRNVIYTGDIGCYTLGYQKPFETQMTCFEMGGSLGIAHGLSKVVGDPIIAIIGDSTFFHAGLPPSVNVVYNRGRVMVVVLDNLTTAMTGHQPHPGTGYSAIGEKAPVVEIERVLEAIGFRVYVINPLRIRESINTVVEAFKQLLEGKPVAVVSRMRCSLEAYRLARNREVDLPVYTIDQDKCTACMACVNLTACPAIIIPDNSRKPVILEDMCLGCGLCAYICPFHAIVVSKRGGDGWERFYTERNIE
ncbi:indolepyruvate ferredoxin oxidoreductase subunit alpha [Thermogladius sp. 4427co]|uniref:indolepyruvate ferredoxin oxidoreductase subunit alpha n=1 Tax=Thermogladius sp. 4427co TaxID=3450718 RepID=UPI003F79657B